MVKAGANALIEEYSGLFVKGKSIKNSVKLMTKKAYREVK